MKKILLLLALLLCAAGYVFLQTTTPQPKLATLMPSGALLYLEAPDFGRLLRDWDASQVKKDWLKSDNYSVFSRSNLFSKLEEVYSQYGDAAGFLPDLKSVIGMAGTDSALALYGIRDVEFLYISRIAEGDFMQSQLWAVRNKFEQRQAGGVPFYLRTDPGSKRTVAFVFTRGYVLLATRDDLVAQALELMAGGANPSIASDRWYRDGTAAASTPGELRLVMNLEALVKSVYFRSYWVQRNASMVRQYWAGVADLKRIDGNITESRVFLRVPDAAPPAAPGSATVSNLLALVPPEAGMYKASRLSNTGGAAALMVQKLIAAEPQRVHDERDAPLAVSPDSNAGNEGDLETRIDEQPLPADAGLSDSVAAVRAMLEKSGVSALLLVQSTSPVSGTFVHLPAVIVLDSTQDWDPDAIRAALTSAAGKLWTTSELGAQWLTDTSGPQPLERLDGLGALLFANRGPLLFLSNDTRLLRAVLGRAGTAPSVGAVTYAAGFRHLRERSNYERVMTALDFATPAPNNCFAGLERPSGAPSFFSGNIASLSRVLANLTEIRVTEEERSNVTMQTVLYQMTN
jgi:hypothetical protein